VESDAPLAWERPEDIEIASVLPPGLAYSENRCGVADIASSGTTTTIVMDQPCWQRALALHGVELGTDQGAPTDIENSMSFLDAPGEFYLDSSRRGRHVIYYIPRAGEDMRRADVVAPVLESLVEGVGTEGRALSDVTFRGLTFAHTTWLEPGTSAGFVHEYASTYQIDQPPADPLNQGGILSETNSIVPAGRTFDHADRVVLHGNRFTGLGAGALLLARGNDNRVEGNVFTDVSSSAIVVNAPRIPSGQRGDALPLEPDEVARGASVVNNWIHDIGVEYRGGNGMLVMAGKDTTIAHNQINDVPHSAIAVFGDDPPELDPPVLRDSMERLRIQNNRISNPLTVLNDGGGIYTAGELGTSFENGAEISGNVVTHPGPANMFRVGIYTDWLSNWAKVRENVVHGITIASGGCAFHYIRNIQFTGNFWDRNAPIWFCLEFGVVENITTADNTVLTGNPEQACAANPACAAIVARAGLEPAYQSLLSGG
jgi:Right handed beta helix region